MEQLIHLLSPLLKRKRYVFIFGITLGIMLTNLVEYTKGSSCAESFNVRECKHIWIPIYVATTNETPQKQQPQLYEETTR